MNYRERMAFSMKTEGNIMGKNPKTIEKSEKRQVLFLDSFVSDENGNEVLLVFKCRAFRVLYSTSYK